MLLVLDTLSHMVSISQWTGQTLKSCRDSNCTCFRTTQSSGLDRLMTNVCVGGTCLFNEFVAKGFQTIPDEISDVL